MLSFALSVPAYSQHIEVGKDSPSTTASFTPHSMHECTVFGIYVPHRRKEQTTGRRQFGRLNFSYFELAQLNVDLGIASMCKYLC